MKVVRSSGAVGVTLAVCLGLLLPLPFILRLGAAGLLAFYLPGWWLLAAIRFRAADLLERQVIAVGTSFGLTVLAALGWLYAARGLSAPALVTILGLVSLLLAGLSHWQPLAPARRPPTSSPNPPPDPHPLAPMDILFFALPVVVAALSSLVNLGYSDYMGDEMNGLLRALASIGGGPETLFEHTKGPVEVLLPAAFGLLVGRFEPFTVRFPFALAHIAGAGGFYLLGRRMFGRPVGLLAALTLLVNGLYLAFGRIVQYQAVVFLMMSLTALLAYRYYRRGDGPSLALAAFLAGIGLLAHYDMLLVLPPAAYLVWRRYGWRLAAWRRDSFRLGGTGLLFLAVCAIFYLPFLLHPHLDKTSSYLGRVVGAASWPGNNFDELYLFTANYNSLYYMILVALLGGGLVVADLARLGWRSGLSYRRWGRRRFFWLALGAGAAFSLVAVGLGRANFVPLLLTLLLFGLLLGFGPASARRRMVYLWLAVSFVGYVFFVDRPRTHLQVIYPAWSLLVAMAAWYAVVSLRRLVQARSTWFNRAAVLAGLTLFALFAGYEYLLFVDAGREYIFTYPAHKSSLYWEDPDFPFGSRRLYGAPHRLGWQMIQQLYVEGRFQADWDSNDDGSNLFWYTLGAPRNPCYPRYYFLTSFEQHDEEADAAPAASWSPDDYELVGQVWNGSRHQIDVYEFAPLEPVREVATWPEPARYPSFVTPADFRARPYEDDVPVPALSLPGPPLFRLSPPALAQIAGQYGDPRIVTVRDKISLLGYDRDDRRAQPGGLVEVTLYWQAVEPVNLPYKVFIHLEGSPAGGASPQRWGQADDIPACGTKPTSGWKVGRTVADRHIIRLPADIPAGSYALRVGLYEPQTGLRLDLLDELGNPQGDSLVIGVINVRSGE